MASWPPELRDLERVASVAQIGGFRPPSTPRTSWMGQVLLGAPGETWPSRNGRPYWGICQIRVDELPMLPPEPLREVALVTIFIDLLDLPRWTPNGDGWELRTHASIDGLVPMLEPERAPVPERRAHEDIRLKPFPVLWRAHVDLPTWDEGPRDSAAYRDFLDSAPDDFEPAYYGLKVGGWPCALQHEVTWGHPPVGDVELAVQIATDEKSGFGVGLSGVVYFGWSPTRGWVMDWQSY